MIQERLGLILCRTMTPHHLARVARSGLLQALVFVSACSSDADTPARTADASAPVDASIAPADASPADAGADSAVASGGILWTDDGTQNSADGKAEALVAGGTIGFALNVADVAHSNNLSVNVTAASAADWKAGTYKCPSGGAAIGYIHSPSGGVTLTPATCSVTVTDTGAVGGAHLKGTFEATFTVSTGGTKTLSNGSFDVAYRPQ